MDPEHELGMFLSSVAMIFLTICYFVIFSCLTNPSDITAENATIEDCIEEDYTFYLDGNKVKNPDKLVTDHYKIVTVDNENYEVIIERTEENNGNG